MVGVELKDPIRCGPGEQLEDLLKTKVMFVLNGFLKRSTSPSFNLQRFYTAIREIAYSTDAQLAQKASDLSLYSRRQKLDELGTRALMLVR